MLKKIRELIHRWEQLWSLPGDLNRKLEHGKHCLEVCFPTLDSRSKSAALELVS
jgi:hypothetical protein